LDGSTCYNLAGEPGLQAFAVVASRQPLPSYETWGRGAELRRLWKPVQAQVGWRFDGRRFDPILQVQRGELKKRPGPPGPFREVCEYLATLPEVEAIQAISFPVRPMG